MLAGHEPRELIVLGAQVVDDHGVKALHAVPRQPLEIFADRVVGGLRDDRVVRVDDGLLAGDAVVFRQVHQQVVVVVVGPRPVVLGDLAPGEVADQLGPVGKAVIPDGSTEVGVLLEDEPDGVRVAHQVVALVCPAVAGEHPLDHRLLPLEVLQLSALIGQFVPEGLLGALPQAVGHGVGLDRRDGSGEVLHGLVGGQPGDGRLLAGLIVEVPELVDPDKVEGVDLPAADGVCAVVAERPFVVVDHQAAGRGALGVGVAPLGGRGLVDVRKELADGVSDVVAAAEGADDAGLEGGVLLLASGGREVLGLA